MKKIIARAAVLILGCGFMLGQAQCRHLPQSGEYRYRYLRRYLIELAVPRWFGLVFDSEHS
jgi:hypothetical protein